MKAVPDDRLLFLADASEHEWTTLQLREAIREGRHGVDVLGSDTSDDAEATSGNNGVDATATTPSPQWPDAMAVKVTCKNPTCLEILREVLSDPNRFHVVLDD